MRTARFPLKRHLAVAALAVLAVIRSYGYTTAP
jgi:hypothetical protein